MLTLDTNNKTKASAEQKPGLPHPSLDRKTALDPNPIWQTLALNSARIQPKLIIGQADDPSEHEADQIADQVMRTATLPSNSSKLSFSSTTPLTAQRKCQECEDEEEKKLQRKELDRGADSLDSAPPIVHEALHSSGQPLDPTTRAFFEPRFGLDFSRVRVHDDAHASASAEAINATAYTLGSEIVFRAGAFSPETATGRKLLAHELVHTAQQSGSSVPSKGGPPISQPGDAAEREAETVSTSALAGQSTTINVKAPIGQALRDTKEYETAGIELDPSEMTKWAGRSYWEQKVFAVLAVTTVTPAGTRLAVAEERDAVFSVLWNTYQSLKPIKAETARPITIPARGTSPALSYLFVFRPPTGKDARERVEVRFEAEGAGAAAKAAPAAAAGASAPASFSWSNFPNSNKFAAWFKSFPDEQAQLFTFLAGATIPSTGQIVTTSSTVGKKLHETTYSITPGTSGLTIEFVAESTPASSSPPAGYTGHDYADLKLEEAGKDKALLGKITLPSGIAADEIIPVKYTIWQYFQSGTRNAEVDTIIPIPGTTPKRVFYTLKFQGGTNAVDVVRIGEEGTAGTVELAKTTFDLARIPDYASHSKDVATLSSWIKTRYSTITAAGTTVADMKTAAEKDIAVGVVKKDWFKNNYGIEELNKTDAEARLRTAQGWDTNQVKDTKDFVDDERRLLERAFETLSDLLLALLKGVPIARQQVFIKKGGTAQAPTYTPSPKTTGDTATLTSSSGGTVTKVNRTVIFFDSWFMNDKQLFVGDTGIVAPASVETPLHEFGHVVGAQAGIKDAFEAKFTAAKAALKTAPITWYAKSDPGKEFFAEAFALYHADPKWMSANLPDMYAWFQTLSNTGKPPP